MAGYLAVLTALITLFCVLLFTRSAVDCTLLRAPGGLFQENNDGKISNLYTVKVVNKSRRDIPVTFRLEGAPGKLQVMGAGQFTVPRENLAQTSILILLDRAVLDHGKAKIKVGVYAGDKRIDTIKTSFIGPRN